ncbi:MAG TPA: phosphatase PAP2 family protein [Acidobacteriota bacterium]|nr:phosphatase PAP2 family protein [Acidobacteriota bacterium]
MWDENQNEKIIKSRPIWIWLSPLIFLLLTGVVLLTNSNKALFLLINQASCFTGDKLWAVLTFFSDGLVSFVILLPLIYKKPQLIWAVFLAAVLFTVFGQGIKHLARIPRPPQVFSPEVFHLIGPDWGHNSFPSGHASMVFNLAGVFSLTARKNWFRFLLIGLASIVAVSRMVVGVHWPVDVLVGAAIGWITIWIGLEVSKKSDWAWKGTGRKIIGAVLMAGCLLLFFVDYTGHEDILFFQRMIAFIFLIAGGHEYARIYGWKGFFSR